MQNGQTVGAGEIVIGREDLQLIAPDITARYGGNAYPKEWGELGQVGFDIVDLQAGDTFGSLGHIHLAQEVVKGREIAVTRVNYPHPSRKKIVADWKDADEPLDTPIDGFQVWQVYRATKAEAAKIDTEEILHDMRNFGALEGSRVTVELIPTETVRAAEITEKHSLKEKVAVYNEASAAFLAMTESIYAKADQLEREATERGACAGMHFRLRRVRIRGAVGIWKGLRQDEIDIDLDKYSPGLLALIGVNGAGKSTAIENMHPYSCMLTRDGPLQEHFRLRDSAREIWFTDERTGTEYRALMEIDGANATGSVKYHLFKLAGGPVGEGRVEADWIPMTNGRKADYDEAIEHLIGSLPLFLRSAFVSQRATKSNPDLADATKGDRKKIFRELAGLDYIQAYSESAKARAGALESQVTVGRGQVTLLERIVAEELDVENACTSATYDRDKAAERIADQFKKGTDFKHHVEQLAAAVAEQDQLGKDIGAAANEAQKKLGQVQTAHTTIEKLQKALNYRILATEEVASHDKLKAEEGAENERLSGINKERARLSALHTDAVKAHSDASAKLQAAKAKLREQSAHLAGDRNVLQAQIDHLAAELGTPLKENCPTCGQVLPENKLSELRQKVALSTEKLADFKKKHREISPQIAMLDQEATALQLPPALPAPTLPPADETELNRIRAALGQIDIVTAQTTLATAAKAEQEIATLTAQIATLEADAAALSTKAEQLRAQMDPQIRTDHQGALRLYEAARMAYTTAKEERATAQAKLEAAQQQLEAIQKQKCQLEDLRTSLAKIEAEAGEWRWLEVATGPDGIQALELDALGPGIAEVANLLLSAAYGNRFSIEFRTTRLAGKGSKTRSVEDFSIFVLDQELLTEQPIETLSGGESVWIKRALYDSFALIRDRTTGLRFLTSFQDEADGALDPESRQKYFAMLEAAHHESGRRHTILITHSPEVQEAVGQRIELKRATV